MFKKILICLSLVLLGIVGIATYKTISPTENGAPPYAIEDLDPPKSLDPYAWIKTWTRPDGPPSVGLQVGHWKNDELPEELHRLVGNTGATGGGKSEAEVNLAIAEETKKLLEAKGIRVDILPATVPPKYWADVFVAIHADGSTDSSTTGYKVAAPRRDFTEKANTLVSLIEEDYGKATGLDLDPNVTRNMRGYYAFAWWRYEHAVHPMTTSVILETGFLTNPSDRKIIVAKPEVSAEGLATAIMRFFESEKL